MESTVNERIREIAKVYKLSIKSFAEKIGVLQQTLNNYMSKDREPSFSVIAKIYTTFVEVNPDWLLTGRGEMTKKQPEENPPAHNNNLNTDNMENGDLFEMLKGVQNDLRKEREKTDALRDKNDALRDRIEDLISQLAESNARLEAAIQQLRYLESGQSASRKASA